MNCGTQCEDCVLTNKKNKTDGGRGGKKEIEKKNSKKKMDFLLLGSSLLVEVFVLGNKVAGMLSYSIFFRGYAFVR